MEKAREYTFIEGTACADGFVWRGLRFFFYSNEREEPAHIHVAGGGREAKIWMADLSVARNRGFAGRELAAILEHVSLHREQLTEAWSRHLGR